MAVISNFQEQRLLEEKMRKQEMEIDYLAPFLAQMGDPEKISRQQAYKLKEDCLADLKQRLIDKANLIQFRFEKVKHFSHISWTYQPQCFANALLNSTHKLQQVSC